MDVRFLEQAAAMGHAEAQYALGTAFLMGDGVPQDTDRAVSLIQKAAEQGDARAQCNLGAMHAQGIGVPHDYNLAKRFYEKSAAQENPDGLYNLAVIYAQGLGGCKKDIAKARELCQKAANKGQDKAQALLPSLVESPTKGRVRESCANDRRSKAEPELPQASAEHAVGRGGVSDRVAETKQRKVVDSRSRAGDSIAPGRSAEAGDSRTSAVTKLREVQFGSSRSVQLQGPSGRQWSGEQMEARFPKQGNSERFRKLFMLKALATEDEVATILRVARTSLEFNVDNDSVDQRPTYERYVVQIGQFIHPELEAVLRPIIEDRLLPYVRQLYQAPDAVVCTVLIRRYLPDERRVHPTHFDGHSFSTAVLGLNAGEFEGGLYVQPHKDSAKREFVSIGRGDLAVHQYDLPHGVRVFDGRRYSIIFWIKDCMHSCVTNATPWYQKAAEAGDVDAMTALGQKLQKGMNSEGVGSDPVQAVRWYREAAELGQVEAQTILGALYEMGRGGLPVDGQEAIRWWQMAAKAGDSAGQRMLALAYANGSCGLRKNEAEAVRWMTLAAEREDADARYWLSACYSRGVGTEQDLSKALLWAQRAAEVGHSEAQYNLGSMHLTGDGVEASVEQAVFWFRRAALNGNAAAQCNLGALYAQGLGGLQQSYDEALHWYQMSAESGNPDGQHNLGLMYSQGLSVQQDFDLARSWCEKAAEQGQAKAIALLRTLPPPAAANASDIRSKANSAGESPCDADGALKPTASVPATLKSEAPAISSEEESFSAKVAEVRNLLAEIRGSSASSGQAQQLLDQLLERTSTLDKSLRAPPHRGICGSLTPRPVPASAPAARESPKGRVVQEIDALDYTAAELVQVCQGRCEPLLLRHACAAVPDVLEKIVATAGQNAVEWELQGVSDARLLKGNLRSCCEGARQRQPGHSVLMQDSKLLDLLELASLAEVPAFLANSDLTNELPEDLRPASRSSFVLGSHGARSQLHQEPPWAGWNRLLLGTSHWRLLPPDSRGLASTSRLVGLCGAKASNIDAFANQDAWKTVQEAGDVLIIPPGWWRQSSHASGLAAAVSSQILDEQALPGMLLCLQASAGVKPVPLTGCITADVRRVAGVLAGKRVERPDRRAALGTREATPAVHVVASQLQTLESAEFVD